MVVGAFPIIKLGSLLVKQISKPIANYVKERAKNSLFFRTYICMPPAQFYNWCEIQTKMWILNLGKPVNIPVLSEAMAIELGANLLGEGIVFVIASAILIMEYNRGARKEEAKEAARKEELENVLNRLHDLYFRVEEQNVQIRELSRTVVALDKSRFTFFKRDTQPVPSTTDAPAVIPQSSSEIINQNETSVKVPIKPKNIQNEIRPEELHSFVLRAASLIQEDITGRDEGYRDNGILEGALNYLQNDVYRRPLCVK